MPPRRRPRADPPPPPSSYDYGPAAPPAYEYGDYGQVAPPAYEYGPAAPPAYDPGPVAPPSYERGQGKATPPRSLAPSPGVATPRIGSPPPRPKKAPDRALLFVVWMVVLMLGFAVALVGIVIYFATRKPGGGSGDDDDPNHPKPGPTPGPDPSTWARSRDQLESLTGACGGTAAGVPDSVAVRGSEFWYCRCFGDAAANDDRGSFRAGGGQSPCSASLSSCPANMVAEQRTDCATNPAACVVSPTFSCVSDAQACKGKVCANNAYCTAHARFAGKAMCARCPNDTCDRAGGLWAYGCDRQLGRCVCRDAGRVAWWRVDDRTCAVSLDRGAVAWRVVVPHLVAALVLALVAYALHHLVHNVVAGPAEGESEARLSKFKRLFARVSTQTTKMETS